MPAIPKQPWWLKTVIEHKDRFQRFPNDRGGETIRFCNCKACQTARLAGYFKESVSKKP